MAEPVSPERPNKTSAMTPRAREKFDLLVEKLREMFQLDRGDLDFGLYRIMNMKAAEIEPFLTCNLLTQVEEVLAGLNNAAHDDLEAELETQIVTLTNAGLLQAQIDEVPKVVQLRKNIKLAKADIATAADIYNHLYQFFARYYDGGDFLSLRRISGGKSTYLIPYDGEEVKLHWANADQYYIKSTENYASYIFTHDGWPEDARVRFEIAIADTEKGDVKPVEGKDRRFILTTLDNHEQIAKDGNDLVIYFDHRPLTDAEKKTYSKKQAPKQDKILADAYDVIIAKVEKIDAEWKNRLVIPAPTDKKPDRDILGKHLATYTAKNSFDYFIHKNLGGFLRQELDLYLKTDVLFLDDLTDAARLKRSLAMMQAIRDLAEKIIDFLAQLENFQKSLWLKKKFVLETNYCLTLDRIPPQHRDHLYPQIAKNKAQIAEWVSLFAADELDDFNAKKLKPDFLDANPYLVLDTCHFDRKFVDDLLAALSDAGSLEDQLDGLLIHGENFQALNLLQARYHQQVQCIYIDPPYNSPSSEIAYKNNYKHSSWMSLIQNRVIASKSLLNPNGFFCSAVDENEGRHLDILIREAFGEFEHTCLSIIHNPRGIQGDGFSYTHEFAHFLFAKGVKVGLRSLKDDKSKPLMKTGGESARQTAQNCFYPILVKGEEIVGFGDVPDDKFSPSSIVETVDAETIKVWPISTSDGQERKWRYARQSVDEISSQLFVKSGRDGNPTIYLRKDQEAYKTVWIGPEFNAAEYGSNLLKNITQIENTIYPKSLWTVIHSLQAANLTERTTTLDYFAGSGTTGHAVMNLNRADDGLRKYILVEVGHHFDTVLRPRLKKVAYSHDWKDGKPVSRDGQSQCFKYIRLEGYEDTLDSLEITPMDSTTTDLLNNNPALAEDYALRYQLQHETAASACLTGGNFAAPYNHNLSVVRDGTRRDVMVDLPETFNLLIGLRLRARRVIDGVLTITGSDADGTQCLILWRDTDTMDNAALNEWFDKNGAELINAGDSTAEDSFVARIIYVNGDHNLNMRQPTDERWTAYTLDTLFRDKMFEGGE